MSGSNSCLIPPCPCLARECERRERRLDMPSDLLRSVDLALGREMMVESRSEPDPSVGTSPPAPPARGSGCRHHR